MSDRDTQIVTLIDGTAAEIEAILRGGPGSGHSGHEGRPGEVGGSLPSGAAQMRDNERRDRISDIFKRALSVAPWSAPGFRASFWFLPDGTIYVAETGHIVSANRAMSEIGLTPDILNKEYGFDADARVNAPMMEALRLGIGRLMFSPDKKQMNVQLEQPITQAQKKTLLDLYELTPDHDVFYDVNVVDEFKGDAEHSISGYGRREFNRLMDIVERGGPGSGHHDHKGRPGEVGGSLPSGEMGDDPVLAEYERQFDQWQHEWEYKRDDLETEMIAKFGTTHDWRKGTWIGPSGKLLNPDGDHQASAYELMGYGKYPKNPSSEEEQLGLDATGDIVAAGLIRYNVTPTYNRLQNYSLYFDIPSEEDLTDEQISKMASITTNVTRIGINTPYLVITIGSNIGTGLEWRQIKSREAWRLLGLVDVYDYGPQVFKMRGGPGSGHRGHRGRPGERGGSLPDTMAGESISKVLTGIPKTPLWEPVNRGIAAIEKVHGVQGLPSLRVWRSKSKKRRGAYHTFIGNDGNWYPESISVVLSGLKEAVGGEETRALTMAHEVGHFLDHMMFGRQNTFTTDDMIDADAVFTGSDDKLLAISTNPDEARAFQQWWEAIRNSDAYAKMQAVEPGYYHIGVDGKAHKGYGPQFAKTVYEITPQLAHSWQSAREYFARSYAQYVATRSGDPWMLNEVEAEMEVARKDIAFTQWEGDDFKPVADAFDGLFDSLGLRR